MPTFIIESEVAGASALTQLELADITAKSNEVVAGLGVPYRWITSHVAGDKIYCVHDTDRVESVLDHGPWRRLPRRSRRPGGRAARTTLPHQGHGRSGTRLMRGLVRAGISVAAVDPLLHTGAGAAGEGVLSESQSDLAEPSRRPGTARPGRKLDIFTTRSRRLVAAAAGLALVAGLATGCGSSSSERRATAVAASADTIEERAHEYVGDPWERRFLVEHQRSQQYLGDPWEQRYLVEHQRMLREPRDCQTGIDAGRC